MRPGSSGEVITESGRDRRYLRRGAKMLKNTGLLQKIKAETNDVYSTLYTRRYRSVTNDDISSARMWGWVQDHRFTEFKSDHGVRAEIAEREATIDLRDADVALPPQFGAEVIQSLGAVASMSKLQAIVYAVRRPVAEQMMADISMHVRSE